MVPNRHYALMDLIILAEMKSGLRAILVSSYQNVPLGSKDLCDVFYILSGTYFKEK